MFEHVEDDIGFIRALQANADYHIFHIPLDIHLVSLFRNGFIYARNYSGHLHYYTAETALATLEDAGYEIIDSFYTKVYQKGGTQLTGKAKILKPFIWLGYRISESLLAKLMGACQLMVLAKKKV